MKVMQELVAYFDKRGKLSRKELKRLLDQNFVASEAPISMMGMCETVGATYYFRVRGVAEGQIWGTDVYTRDSTLGAAAVHAGLLKVDETGVLRVTVMAGQDGYKGTTRNGVTTADYGPFPQAWKLSAI